MYTGDSILKSRTGTHQGCPLGPLGFALAIQPTLEKLQRDAGLVWQCWYLDDGLLLGYAEAVSQAFATIKGDLAQVGLTVNSQKCEVWGPPAYAFSTSNADVCNVPWTPDSGTIILGTPVTYPGTGAFAKNHWNKTNSQLEKATQLVTTVADAQLAHHLLRQCLNACKVNHLLRATYWYASYRGVKGLTLY